MSVDVPLNALQPENTFELQGLCLALFRLRKMSVFSGEAKNASVAPNVASDPHRP